MKGLIYCFLFSVFVAGCTGSKKESVSISLDEARENIGKLEKEAAEKPGDTKALFKLAQAHAATGELDAALQELDAISSLDRNFANAYLLRANVYSKTSQQKEELQTLLALLDLPHGHNYIETISQQVGMPYSLKTLNLGSGNNTLARYSPDGQHIVWQSDRDGDWNIYMAAADGTGTQAITLAKGDDEAPIFSPDKKFIAFTSHRDDLEPRPVGDENREIYTYELVSRQERRLTKNNIDDWAPIFYPDSSSLVYVSEEPQSKSTKFIDRKSMLYFLRAKQGDSEVVASDEDDNTSPSALPDGRLVWIQIQDGLYNIVTAGSGTEQEILFSSKNPKSGLNPVPDGSGLVFFMKKDENIDIYQLNFGQTEPIRLTASHSKDLYPVYSPDGSKIMFSSDRHGKWGLFLLDLRTTISKAELRSRLQTLIDQIDEKQNTE